MIQPLGFVNPTFPNHVCHLQKTPYGLCKLQELGSIFLVPNLLNSGSNIHMLITHSLLIMFLGHITINLIYVDCKSCYGNNCTLPSTISLIFNLVALEDLGPVYYFPKIEAVRTSSGLLIALSKRITNLLHRVKIDDA